MLGQSMKEVFGTIYVIINTVNQKKYVGQTTRTFKERYGNNVASRTHNKHLKNAIKKYGEENFKVIENYHYAYSKEELDYLEKFYIELWVSHNPKYGYNKTLGGEGGAINDELRKYYSQIYTGEGNPFYGKKHSEETKELMKKNHRNYKKENHPQYGMPKSEEQKQKSREAQWREKSHSAKKIVCLNTGECFGCILSASKWCGLVNSKFIHRHLSGKAKSAGKHPQTGEALQWCYYEDYLAGNYEYLENYNINTYLSERQTGGKNHMAKKVKCVNTGEIFDTVKEAKLKYNAPGVSKCCMGKLKTSGKHPVTQERLMWQYA